MAHNEPSGYLPWLAGNAPWPVERNLSLTNRFIEWHSDGISVCGFFKTIAKFRWEEISHVYVQYDFYLMSDNMVQLEFVRNPRIVGTDGTEIALRGTIGSEPEQLLDWIYRKTGQRLLNSACDDFVCGRPITFGDLIVTKSGLHARGTSLNWHELKYLMPPVHAIDEEPFPELLFYESIRTRCFPRSNSVLRLFLRDEPGYGTDRVANLRILWEFVHRLCTSEPSDPWYPLVPINDHGPGFD